MRPTTAKALQDYSEKSANATCYSSEYQSKGVKEVNILNLEEKEEGDSAKVISLMLDLDLFIYLFIYVY